MNKTPMPWEIGNKPVNAGHKILSLSGELIGYVHLRTNAAIIVKAVNNHEPLLNALSVAIIALEQNRPSKELTAMKQALANAQAAL